MPRTLTALVLLALILPACDSVVETPTAEVSVGARYAGTTMAVRDAATGEVRFDYLAAGATMEIAFTDRSRFTASLFVPYEAMVAAGETDDLDGDVDLTLSGTYRQSNGVLTFTPDEDADSFFDQGWFIDADGGAVRYTSASGGQEMVVVLTRG